MSDKNGKLLVFSAPSGSGKTTIIKKLLEFENLNMKFSVSATNRPKRNYETHGKDYFFLSDEEFQYKIKNNEFIEWEEVYEGRFYGTLRKNVEELINKGFNIAFDIDVKGALSIKKEFGDDSLLIFVKTPSIEELEKRLRKRNTENEESLKQRISKAKEELGYAEKFDLIVVNDILENAVKESRKDIESFLNKR